MLNNFACKYSVATLADGRHKIQRKSLTASELKEYLLRVFREVPGKMPTPCWEWPGHKSPKGYGMLGFQKKVWRVHRIFWELVNGSVSRHLEVCHHCDNPACYRLEHLFLGTHSDNIKDAKRKNRLRNPKGEEHGNAKLTDDQVLEIRKLYKPGRHYSGKVLAKDVAKKFGISLHMVYRIVHRINWKHLK